MNTLTREAEFERVQQGDVTPDDAVRLKCTDTVEAGRRGKMNRRGEVDVAEPRVLLEAGEDFPVSCIQRRFTHFVLYSLCITACYAFNVRSDKQKRQHLRRTAG